MSITNYDVSSGAEGHQVTCESSSTSVGSGGTSTIVESSGLPRPSCLENQELRVVEEMNTHNSRFYVGDKGLCLVEAVEMTNSPGIDLDEILERVERKLIQYALEKTGGARAGAARLMGISRSRLYRRLHALGLDNGHDRGDGNDVYPVH
jgi:transcriptional regulator with GAF, ATPase, and Fis domain